MNNINNKIVVVVDNDPMMLQSIVRLLDAGGFATRGFSSAEAFLAGESATEASCAVLDINLDGMSGIELRRRLAGSGYAFPVVFITAMNDETVEREARSSGCAAYLRKPFRGTELIGAVRQAVC